MLTRDQHFLTVSPHLKQSFLVLESASGTDLDAGTAEFAVSIT